MKHTTPYRRVKKHLWEGEVFVTSTLPFTGRKNDVSFIVTVEWRIEPKHAKSFAALAKRQAENSVNLEANCVMFDLCVAENDPNLFFMYEAYTDGEAFKEHLASDHFAHFSDKISDMVISRVLRTFKKV